MSDIETKIDGVLDGMTALKVSHMELHLKMDAINQKTNRHDYDLYGNGKAGIIREIDRLLQIEDTRKWVIRTMVVTVLGIASHLIIKAL
jgi:hypothetical protein